MCASLVSFVGTRLEGRYRSPRSGTTVVKFEVSAVAAIPDGRGIPRAYLVGTRLDGPATGQVQALRAGAFHPAALESATRVENFEPVTYDDYFVTPQSEAFGWLERLPDPEDQAWASAQGGRRLADYIVSKDGAPKRQKAKGKA